MVKQINNTAIYVGQGIKRNFFLRQGPWYVDHDEWAGD